MKVKDNLKFVYVRNILYFCPKKGILTWKVNKSPKARTGQVAGTINGEGYRYISIDSSLYKACRLAWLLYYKRWPRGQIDHINHVRSDDRIENLREANKTDQARNCTMNKRNKSGFNGVSFESGKWVARIRAKEKYLNLGRYNNKEDAIHARKIANIEYGFHENHGRK